MKVKVFYEPNFREWRENDDVFPPLRSAGGTMGGGSEGIIVTYQDVTGTFTPGQHCGSYNGQDAYNDLLVTEEHDTDIFDTENGRVQGIGSEPHVSGERLQECDRPDSEGGCCMDKKQTVRRLTPLEAERLQGMPDNWTNIGDWTDENGKTHKYADTPRYKAIGNSICLPFWKFLARRVCAQYERTITMGSLFDGISCFPLVFSECGAVPIWSSEIEPFCIAVSKAHFPESEDNDNVSTNQQDV